MTTPKVTDRLPAGRSHDFQQTLPVESPQRWDVDSPRLYTAQVTLKRDGQTGDTHTTVFGIRTFRFTTNDGFHLNGRRVQLKGVDLRHGHGPLGAASFPRAMQRKLKIMKDMGANAIRTSHNAAAPGLLDLCNRMGILVFNECFDKWTGTADLLPGASKPDRQPCIRVFRSRVGVATVAKPWALALENHALASVATGMLFRASCLAHVAEELQSSTASSRR